MPRRSPTSNVVDAILQVLWTSSLIGVTLVAPNAIQVIGKLHIRHSNKLQRNRELNRLIHYMKRQGNITVEEVDDKYEIKITGKGKLRVLKLEFDSLAIITPRKWDRRWRLVMFDIPETHSTARRALTNKLQELGFKILQKSIWVHPFPCNEQVEVIKAAFPAAAPYIVYLETEQIDNHNQLVQRFKELLP